MASLLLCVSTLLLDFVLARPQPVLYEISLRPWLYSLAQSGIPAKCGEYVCLKDVPQKEWQQMADNKIDMVWLMGAWELGSFGPDLDKTHIDSFRKDLPDVQADDIIGSPYAVRNYTMNSNVGTPADLAEVRSKLKALGMKLMLDFVPNHGAVDSVLVDKSPDIFIQHPQSGNFKSDWWIQRDGHNFAYGRGPYDGPWTDTLQYNYWNQQTIDTMTNILIAIAAQADAIRCDMAMLLLNEVVQRSWNDIMQGNGFHRPSAEFWDVAIKAVRKHFPDTIFMAEAYNYGMTNPPEKQLLQELGFDVVYDKSVLDQLDSGNLDGLRGYIGSQSQGFFEHTAHFVENHDEKRSASALGGQQQAFVGSVVASTIPGLRLFYFGQFDGFASKLDVQLRRASAETPNTALQAQYRNLLSVISHEVFHTGTWTFIQLPKDGTAWRLAAWRWSSKDGVTKRVIVVNFSDQRGWANIQLPDAESNGSDKISLTELLTGAVYQRSVSGLKSTGLVCGVDAWTAQIFSYDRSQSSQPTVVV